MPRFTVREFAKTVGLEEVGPDYVGAGIMLKMLCKHGLAKEVDKLTSTSGKGRKSMVYELSDKIVLDFSVMQAASKGFAPKAKKPPRQKKQKEVVETSVTEEIETPVVEIPVVETPVVETLAEAPVAEVATDVLTQWEEEVKETDVVKQEAEVVETAPVENAAAPAEPLTFYSYGEDDEDEEAA